MRTCTNSSPTCSRACTPPTGGAGRQSDRRRLAVFVYDCPDAEQQYHRGVVVNPSLVPPVERHLDEDQEGACQYAVSSRIWPALISPPSPASTTSVPRSRSAGTACLRAACSTSTTTSGHALHRSAVGAGAQESAEGVRRGTPGAVASPARHSISRVPNWSWTPPERLRLRSAWGTRSGTRRQRRTEHPPPTTGPLGSTTPSPGPTSPRRTTHSRTEP